MSNGRLQFDAPELARALRPLMAKGVTAKRVGPIHLSFTNSRFVVAGSWFGAELPATGDWPGTIAVAPSTFLSLLRGVPESGSVSLVLQDGILALGGHSIRVAPETTNARPVTRDPVPGPATNDGHLAAVVVARHDFEAACSLIKKHCRSSSQLRATLGFAGSHLELEIAGLGTRTPATGAWAGTANVPSSFLLGIAKLPPPGDPISIRIEEGRLHIGGSSVACIWHPSPMTPPPAPSVEILEWSGKLSSGQWGEFRATVLAKFNPTDVLDLQVALKVTSTAGVSKQTLDELKSALRELELNDDVTMQ